MHLSSNPLTTIKRFNGLLLNCLIVLLVATFTLAGSAPTYANYIYAWPFVDHSAMAPRGGITQGPGIKVDTDASAEWRALQQQGLSKKERDRRAILAMAGPYRASFDFLETLVFGGDFKPARPYRSWGTEYIYVVADEPELIILQHIMVMVFKNEDGSLSEPLVIKHWRQEWRFEDCSLHVYAGDNRWREKRLSQEDVKGKWSQAVYQVDDSPRYEAIGEWTHTDNYSSWLSEETWRPLPRREFSVRDDYNVLVGTNRHTILPSGWVQEEDNLKVQYDSEISFTTTFAREHGVNRYERVAGYDWSAGDAYWQQTGPYWELVREAWADVYRNNREFRLEKRADGQSLVMTMFKQAEKLTTIEFDRMSARAEISRVLKRFLSTSDSGK